MTDISISQLSSGDAFLFHDDPYIILKMRSRHLGRGGALYRVKMRNLKKGNILTETFRPSDKVTTVAVEKRPLNFMYADQDRAYFVDLRTYQQQSMALDKIESFSAFLKEGEKYYLIFLDGEPIDFSPPQKIERCVIKAPKAVAGDTVNAASKKVTIEGGEEISTPLFIKEDDKIVIRTADNSYVEKVSD